MPYFVLTGMSHVTTALDTISTIHGAYRAVDLLTQVLADVEEPEGFEAEVRELEARQGPSYQGPEQAGRVVIKAVKTAANAKGDDQDALLQLVALILVKLGVAQGSRVLSLLLLSAGVDPALFLVILKLCVLLGQTEMGRQIVSAAQPRIRETFSAYADKMELAQSLQRSLGQLGEQAFELVSVMTDMPLSAVKRAMASGSSLLDALADRLNSPEQ